MSQEMHVTDLAEEPQANETFKQFLDEIFATAKRDLAEYAGFFTEKIQNIEAQLLDLENMVDSITGDLDADEVYQTFIAENQALQEKLKEQLSNEKLSPEEDKLQELMKQRLNAYEGIRELDRQLTRDEIAPE
mmetsp:Transcript_11644/g.17648  ORF Transcript_11644/g.17648 Transcript_11644/m.17648 type:complete len:133 (-) Transcript_11644:22-420(-)|eukprot:CAMPEP_0201511170 /NCGR_PEP_ID=MMETSP0161_2-20130828/3656_1 /ASSEMBLY_ACC=CAM_ASM_000251 /TAXON_ID=180227 /ORGANISM="Neoparamoeba aestuarina, Strain SoJaBio B1-5/56/2" /LENGTH=132 /DNA_ID=CAMNT_0047906539 /DNA_START=1 /DNA_END=399 /DNA_ORIENTATION=+